MELYFSVPTVESLNLYPKQHVPSIAGFCFLSRGHIIAKKLDFARWQEALNTSYSLLAFAHFCWGSLRSHCKVRISFNNSGCLSFCLKSSHCRKGFCCTLLCCGQTHDKSHILSCTSRELLVICLGLFASLIYDFWHSQAVLLVV